MANVQDDARKAGEFIFVPGAWFTDDVPKIDALAQHRITAGLRALYCDLLQQPLPPALVALIRQFDQEPEHQDVARDERRSDEDQHNILTRIHPHLSCR